MQASGAEKKEGKNEVDEILDLIPSWKYFKIISQEYSRRSADYTGDDNMLAPLL